MQLPTKCETKGLKMKGICHISFANYNVSTFYTNKGLRNGINKLVDPLVEALNGKTKRLPKYILVIPDADILKDIDWDEGISIIIGAALHYVIKEHDKLIGRRRDILKEKKPGCHPRR